MEHRDYSNDELNEFEILTDDLIRWMFNKPNDRHPILEQIKKAFDLGETKCCEKLLDIHSIESVPSNVDTFEKVLAYIEIADKQRKAK